jgi:hypothetical protein
MERGRTRRLLLRCLVLVVSITGLTLVSPNTASASAWRCGSASNHIMQGTICFRTIRKDANHISGADIAISHSVYSAGGCLWMRFDHAIQLGNGQIINGPWQDDGYFLSCPGEDHTYSWTHGGAGAWLGDGWNVAGRVLMYRSDPDPFKNPDGRAVAPWIWWPNH